MKKLIPFILAVSVFPVAAQKKEPAVGRYAENGKLISVTNLSGLSDCETRILEGKVKKVKVNGDVAFVKLSENKSTFEFEAPLERLKPDDRNSIMNDLLLKKIKLRVTGYSCDPSKPVSAFSIDRVY